MNKLQIVKDGEIQGSFIATMITIIMFSFLILGFFFEIIRIGWERIGGTATTLYLGQLASWLAYRGAKTVFGPQPPQPQPQLPQVAGQVIPQIVSAIQKPVTVGPVIVEPKPEPLKPTMVNDKEEVIVEEEREEKKDGKT